jgi:acyl carrier protein
MLKIAKSTIRISKDVRCSSSPFSTVPAACYLPVSEVTTRVMDIVKSNRAVPASFTEDSHFVADLQFDSLVRQNLNVLLMDEFCITGKKGEGFFSIFNKYQSLKL